MTNGSSSEQTSYYDTLNMLESMAEEEKKLYDGAFRELIESVLRRFAFLFLLVADCVSAGGVAVQRTSRIT